MNAIVKLLLALAAGFALNVQAAIIDFEDVPEGTISTDVVSNGFRFQANRNGAIYFTNGVACTPVCAANGTRTMLVPGPLLAGLGFADQVAVSRAGGGEFVLLSLDAAEVFSFPLTQDSAARIDCEPDNPTSTSPGSIAWPASAMARATLGSRADRLYSAPCGLM